MFRNLPRLASALGILGGMLLVGLMPASPLEAGKKKRAAIKGPAYPGRTDAGEFTGSWYYLFRGGTWALWFRDNDGTPEMRLQFRSKDSAESFRTDWNASADYHYRERPGEFRLEFLERTPNLIRARWYWILGREGVSDSVRIETAEIQIYRLSDGRQTRVDFVDFEKVHRGVREIKLDPEFSWTFQKASRREIEWKEFPF